MFTSSSEILSATLYRWQWYNCRIICANLFRDIDSFLLIFRYAFISANLHYGVMLIPISAVTSFRSSVRSFSPYTYVKKRGLSAGWPLASTFLAFTICRVHLSPVPRTLVHSRAMRWIYSWGKWHIRAGRMHPHYPCWYIRSSHPVRAYVRKIFTLFSSYLCVCLYIRSLLVARTTTLYNNVFSAF